MASAAHVGAVRIDVPITVHSGVPPSARATARTLAATGSAAPASITPERVERGAANLDDARRRGNRRSEVLTTNSARRAVALMAAP